MRGTSLRSIFETPPRDLEALREHRLRVDAGIAEDLAREVKNDTTTDAIGRTHLNAMAGSSGIRAQEKR